MTVRTDETKIINWIEDNSDTGLASSFFEVVSYVTTVGTEAGAAIRAFQIIMFIEGTKVSEKSDIKLARNVISEVLYSRDGVLVRDGDLDEEGYGSTLEEASFDFLTSLYDRYISLSRRMQRLADTELSILERLRTTLGQNQ